MISDTLHPQVHCPEIDLTFVSCPEKEDYETRLASSLAEMRCRSEVSSVVGADLLAVTGNFGRLLPVSNRACWLRENYNETLVPEW